MPTPTGRCTRLGCLRRAARKDHAARARLGCPILPMRTPHTSRFSLALLLSQASGFFLASMVAQVMRSLHGAEGEHPKSLLAKRIVAGVNVGILLLDGVLALLKAPAWSANLCEWTLALTVLLYHCTFAYDLSGARIALMLPAPTTLPLAASSSSTC